MDSGGGAKGPLEARLCQVVGLNQNYVSPSGTLYHVQIEDRGPVRDAVSERVVRRVNVLVYANYGDPNARIIHARDHDFEDLRTNEHNHFIERKIQELSSGVRQLIGEKEIGQVQRIKALLARYYQTKDDAAKAEFEQANAIYPFLFSRAWTELKQEKGTKAAEAAAASAKPIAPPEPVSGAALHYPLDAELREHVLDIERVLSDLERDIERLKTLGAADPVLLQTYRKLVARAKESVAGRDPSEFTLRRLEITRNSLATTWRQVRSMLRSTESDLGPP